MVRVWLHKKFWRKKRFRQHFWGEWSEPKTIRLRHLDSDEITRQWTYRKRGCPCGAWQNDKISDTRSP